MGRVDTNCRRQQRPAVMMQWISICFILFSVKSITAFTPSVRKTPLSRTIPLSPYFTTDVRLSKTSPSNIRLYAIQDDEKSSTDAPFSNNTSTATSDTASEEDEATTIQKLEAKYTTEVTRLKFSLAQARQDLEQMEQMASSFEDLSKSLEERLEAEMEEKNVELKRLETELVEKFGYQLQQTKNQAEILQNEASSEIQSLQSTISELEITIESMKAKSMDMEKKIGDLRQQVKEEVESKRMELQDLEVQLTNKFSAEAELLKQDLLANDELISKLKLDANLQQEEFTRQSKLQSQKMERIIKSLQNELNSATTDLKKAKANEGSWRKAINKTRNTFMAQMRKMRADAAKELEDVKTRMTKEMQEMEKRAKKEAGLLTKERDAVKEELVNMTAAKIELGNELVSFREEMTTLLAETKENATNELEAFREESDADTKRQLSELEEELTNQVRAVEEAAEQEAFRLTRELEQMTKSAMYQKDRSLRLIRDLEMTKRNMQQEIDDTKNKANRDFQRLRLELTKKMVDQKAKADLEYDELLKERNKSVLERDLEILRQADKIDMYEEERSSVRTMTRRSLELVQGRVNRRYEKVEEKLPFLRATRRGVGNVSRRVVKRKDGTSRLAFLRRNKNKKGYKAPPVSEDD